MEFLQDVKGQNYVNLAKNIRHLKVHIPDILKKILGSVVNSTRSSISLYLDSSTSLHLALACHKLVAKA